MKRTLLISVALALLLPATAAAKEIGGLQACGLSGCAKLNDRALLAQIGEGSNGEANAPVPALQPFYKLVYTVNAAPGEQFQGGKKHFTFTSWYVPGAKVTQSVDEGGYITWFPVTPEFAAALTKLTSHLRPYPAPKVSAVRIGGRDVKGAQSYTRLLTAGTPETMIDAQDWASVFFFSKRPSPWTRGGILMDLSQSEHALFRGGTYVRLPSDVADAAARGDTLPAGGGSFPWSYLVIVLLLAAVAAAAFVVARRRPRPSPVPRPEPS